MARIHRPEKYYTQVSNALLCHREISFKAKGLYAYLLSKPDTYEFAYDRITWETSDKRKAIASGMQELIKHKFVYQQRMHTGKMEYWLFNTPEEFDQFLASESPQVGLRSVAKTSLKSPQVQNGRMPKRQDAQTAQCQKGSDNKEGEVSKKDFKSNKEKAKNLKEKKDLLKFLPPDLQSKYKKIGKNLTS